MERITIFELGYDEVVSEAYRAGMDRFGSRIGAERIGGQRVRAAPLRVVTILDTRRST